MKPGAAAPASITSSCAAANPRVLAIATVAIAAVYFGLFNHDFSVNGLRYADDVERGIELFHPNHLLPNALYRVAYRIMQALGDGRAIWLMQAINAGAGIAAAAAIARIAARHAGAGPALLFAGLYAFGFAAWNFAEEPDVYVLPAAAVALSLALLDARDRLDWPALLTLAALAIFAVLMLQQYVFWYPALLALVARRDLGADRRRKLLALAAGIPALCLGAYLAAGAALGQLGGLDETLGWFLGYAWGPHGGFGTYRDAPELGSRLLGAVLGLGNLVVAYEVILHPLALAATVLALLVLLWLAGRTAATLRRAPAPLRADAAVIAAYGVANLAFAFWWESRNIEFLFPAWLAAMVLGAFAARALDRRLLVLAVALVGIVNLGVAFWPQRDWPARYRVADALAQHEHLTAADLLITEELNTVGYLHYFARTDVQFEPGAVSAAMHASVPVAQVRAAIKAALAAGTRVYTTELDEHGRLRAIARWFAPLGRRGFDGAVDRDIESLYRGFDLDTEPVAGARRVLAPAR